MDLDLREVCMGSVLLATKVDDQLIKVKDVVLAFNFIFKVVF